MKIDIEIESSHEAKATIDAKCLPYPISTGDAIRQTATTIQVSLKRGKNKTTLTIPMEEVELWSEFQQPLYVADLTLDSQDGVDKKQERLASARSRRKDDSSWSTGSRPSCAASMTHVYSH